MNTAKIAIFTLAGEPIKMEKISIPEPGPGQILVKNEFTTLCRSDINTFCGKRIEKTPTILGHETVGRIDSFGCHAPIFDSRGDILLPGDRITWTIYASEPNSDLARKGIPQKAPGLFKYGHEEITPDSNLHGGLGEYILLRANTPVVKISETVPVELAATVNCAVSTVAGTIRLAGEIQGKNVLVSGAGMLGILACAMCKVKGAREIFAIDQLPERVETALRFGATFGSVVNEVSHGEIKDGPKTSISFDVILEFSGTPDLMEETLNFLTIGGVAVWVGAAYPSRKTLIDAEKVVRNLWTIKGLHNYNEDDLIDAVTFIENHCNDFPFTTLIHNDFSLDDVNEAFAYAITKNPYRAGVKI